MSHVAPGALPLHPPEHINTLTPQEGAAHHPPGLSGAEQPAQGKAEQPAQGKAEPPSQSFYADSPVLVLPPAWRQ